MRWLALGGGASGNMAPLEAVAGACVCLMRRAAAGNSDMSDDVTAIYVVRSAVFVQENSLSSVQPVDSG